MKTGIELIKIVENEDGDSTVSARDLYIFLEVKKDFTSWCKHMFTYGFVENTDYCLLPRFGEQSGRGGHNKIDYALTINTAKEIAMVQRTDRGKEARQYFIECERQLLLKSTPALPQTYSEALRQLADKTDMLELADVKIGHLQLKTNTLEVKLDLLLDWVSIIKVAQHNKVKEKVFNWRALKKECNALGYEVKRAESPRFGYQNLYHINSFKNIYPEFNYDLVQTLE
jgi:phage anti-repressor protein